LCGRLSFAASEKHTTDACAWFELILKVAGDVAALDAAWRQIRIQG
jgi:hypothetical protein